MSIAGVLLSLTTLAGCAGASVKNVAAVNPGGPTPVEILVAVDSALPAGDPQAQIAAEVGSKLQSKLVRDLTEARIPAEPLQAASNRPGTTVLHVSITKADPGNAVERFVIGFGAGRAQLQLTADLQSIGPAGARSMTSFNTTSDTGRMPGLILPGGVALATQNVVHLIIGGATKVATSFDDNLDKPVGKTSSAIVDQMEKYYASVGWYWPATA